jgi:hypothetical protein
MGIDYVAIITCDQCGEEMDRVSLDDVHGTHLAYPKEIDSYSLCSDECYAAVEEETVAENDTELILTKEIAERFVADEDSVDFKDFSAIEEAAYEILVLNGQTQLSDSLTSLSDKVAESLSKHEGKLGLRGITNLSDAAAESLSKHKGEINLSGLTSLSDGPGHIAVTESLSKHNGEIDLSGLTTLSDAAAENLSTFEGTLILRSLTELSDAAAQSLSKPKGKLYLNSLTVLSDAAAECLSKHTGDLWLGSLANLSDAAAAHLGQHQGMLDLNGLTEISDAAAESLGRHRGNIYIHLDLGYLPESAAQILRDAGHGG